MSILTKIYLERDIKKGIGNIFFVLQLKLQNIVLYVCSAYKLFVQPLLGIQNYLQGYNEVIIMNNTCEKGNTRHTTDPYATLCRNLLLKLISDENNIVLKCHVILYLKCSVHVSNSTTSKPCYVSKIHRF